ncbi:hypothetical protein [Sulfurihydrogenibium sp.]|jgi:hypothetical protein|uniref:hypothetical protein n=1 Tax=Sulfurihydrogenibium sp. TaxID=2053621 RepID=UPI0026397305|nr:hypothetical protein [Sulfurihydrogenibium sp.]
MKRYKIVPISFFSHDYEILDGNRPIVYIKHSYTDFDSITILETNKVYKLRGYREWYEMGWKEDDGIKIIRADKSSIFRNQFTIRLLDGREIILRKEFGLFIERYAILEKEGSEIGFIKRKIFHRKRECFLSHEIPLEILAFMVWITIILKLQPDLDYLLIPN